TPPNFGYFLLFRNKMGIIGNAGKFSGQCRPVPSRSMNRTLSKARTWSFLMATQAQIDANRQNAQLSTGPTTDEGKERTRHNATRHGLSGDGTSLPPGMAREVEVMEAGLVAERTPRSDPERFWLHRYALEMVRLDHAERAFMTAWDEQCQRAREAWDQD